MAYNIEVVTFLKPVKSSPVISAPIRYVHMYIKNEMKISDIDYQPSKEFDLCLVCLRLVYPVLPVSLDSLVAPLVFSNVYLIIFLKVE